MEAKLNIAEILKDKPSGTKLYADAFGELSLERVKVNKVISIFVKTKRSISYSFYSNGSYTKEGEPILVPSKEMRDWSKFAWKKGDVLVSDGGCIEAIFDRWYDDTYTSFYCKHYLDSEDENDIRYLKESICLTWKYSLEDTESFLCYVNTIEERLGGKLNLKTLEIEKQPEFKDGDILFVRCDKYNYIEIFNYFKNNGDLYDHASLNIIRQSLDTSGILKIFKEGILELRLATEQEKQQLFDALAKKGKAWNADKKQIVDLKPKWTPKPFDKVMTRVDRNAIWSANIFSHIDQNGEYVTIGCIAGYPYCLPYNEETAKLIGTSDDWEE